MKGAKVCSDKDHFKHNVNVVQNCRPCSFPIRQTLRIALEILRI